MNIWFATEDKLDCCEGFYWLPIPLEGDYFLKITAAFCFFIMSLMPFLNFLSNFLSWSKRSLFLSALSTFKFLSIVNWEKWERPAFMDLCCIFFMKCWWFSVMSPSLCSNSSEEHELEDFDMQEDSESSEWECSSRSITLSYPNFNKVFCLELSSPFNF